MSLDYLIYSLKGVHPFPFMIHVIDGELVFDLLSNADLDSILGSRLSRSVLSFTELDSDLYLIVLQ